jgi:hypothetical protein
MKIFSTNEMINESTIFPSFLSMFLFRQINLFLTEHRFLKCDKWIKLAQNKNKLYTDFCACTNFTTHLTVESIYSFFFHSNILISPQTGFHNTADFIRFLCLATMNIHVKVTIIHRGHWPVSGHQLMVTSVKRQLILNIWSK